jgi:hypothetical protein
MDKKKISIILNFLIVVFEIIGFIVVVRTTSKVSIEYYTEDGNILALISSSLFLVFMLMKKDIPKVLKMFKYISTIGLAVTFFVVIFVLAPMYNFDYGYLLLKDGLLYQHLICPVLGIISFVLVDDIGKISVRDNIMGLSFTILYGFVLVILNITGIVVGPYPFLKVKEQSIIMSCLWFIVIDGLAFLIAFLLRMLTNKFNK